MSPSRNPVNDPGSADRPDLSDRWREGKYLPHWDGRLIPQSITFRIAGSVPSHLLHRWKQEINNLDDEKRRRKLRERIQAYLDRNRGRCWLEHPRIARCVQETLLKFDEDRYVLHAWVIMPNHVHVLCSMTGDEALSDLLHSWRSYTAQVANRCLERSGSFWHDDYFDRYIRDDEHFSNTVLYIEANPVKAGLCEAREDWKWSSAWLKEQGMF